MVYYRRLRQVTEHGAWEAWVLYMLEAVEATARLTLDKIFVVRSLLDKTLSNWGRASPILWMDNWRL